MTRKNLNSRQRPASVHDVAHLARVSTATVSNALNHPERLRPELLVQVHEAIDELGYVPSEHARQLRTGQSKTLGLLLLDAWNPGFIDLARGVEDVAISNGWTLLISNSGRDYEREQRYLRVYSARQVAGMVVVPHDRVEGELHRVRSRGIPLVIADRLDVAPDSAAVGVDDVLGGRLAAEHLIALGHRHLAFVGSEASAFPVHQRLAGIRQVIAESERPIRLDIFDAPLTVEGGMDAGHQIAAADLRPTAVIAAIDLVAFGVLQALLQHSIRVPDDVSLCGYDDIEFSQQLFVPLTTVHRPHYEMGAAAAELLNDIVEGAPRPDRRRVFAPTLEVRASTGAARA